MQYVLRFTGKVSWEGQANGLPSEVHSFIIFEGKNSAEVTDTINTQHTIFVRYQAMFIQRDQTKVIDIHDMAQERLMIPMRWIVSISTDLNPLTQELSLPDAEGVERLSDGTEPTKH